MLHFDGQRYRLIAWSDMPNHVHALVAQAEGMSLGTIVHSWKSFTARKINEISARQGQFWALDYFDGSFAPRRILTRRSSILNRTRQGRTCG